MISNDAIRCLCCTNYTTKNRANTQQSIWDGESGPGARPILQEWVTEIRDQCLRARVPFFFKQWGGARKKRAGRTLEGRTWDEMPVSMSLAKA